MRLRVPRPVGLRSLVLAALCPVALLAQVRPESTSGVAAASIAAAPQAAGQAAGQAPDSSRVAPTGTTAARPLSDSLTLGGRVVPAGTTVQGPIVVAGGDLDVRGTIVGSAVAIAGDVVVHDGGRITGDAIAAFGAVTLDGGTIGGAMRSLTGLWGESLRSTFRGDEGVAPTSRSPCSSPSGGSPSCC